MSAASEVLAGRGSRTRSHQHQRRAVPLFRNHGAPTTRAATRRGTCSRLVAPTSAPSLASAEARSSGSRTAQGLAAPERPGRVASTRPRGTSSLTRRCSGLASLAAELHSLGHRGFSARGRARFEEIGAARVVANTPQAPSARRTPTSHARRAEDAGERVTLGKKAARLTGSSAPLHTETDVHSPAIGRSVGSSERAYSNALALQSRGGGLRRRAELADRATSAGTPVGPRRWRRSRELPRCRGQMVPPNAALQRTRFARR